MGRSMMENPVELLHPRRFGERLKKTPCGAFLLKFAEVVEAASTGIVMLRCTHTLYAKGVLSYCSGAEMAQFAIDQMVRD